MKYTLSNQPVIIISIDQLTIHCNVPIVISYAYEYTLFFLLMKGSKKSVEIIFVTLPLILLSIYFQHMRICFHINK